MLVVIPTDRWIISIVLCVMSLAPSYFITNRYLLFFDPSFDQIMKVLREKRRVSNMGTILLCTIFKANLDE